MQTFNIVLVYAAHMLRWFHSTAMHKLCDEGLPADAFEDLLNLCDGVFPELKVLLQDLCQLPE